MSFSIQNSNQKGPINSDEHLIEALRGAFKGDKKQQLQIKFFINEIPKEDVSVLRQQKDANDKVSWNDNNISESIKE